MPSGSTRAPTCGRWRSFYELLTRQTPLGPQNASTLVTTMLTKPPTTLSNLRPDAPPKLDAILTRCLQKLPERRYSTAGALAAALAPYTTPRARAALDSLRRAGRPTGAAAPAEKGSPKIAGARPGAGRHRRIAIGIAIGLLVATVALLGLVAGVPLARRMAGPQLGPRSSASASAAPPSKRE